MDKMSLELILHELHLQLDKTYLQTFAEIRVNLSIVNKENSHRQCLQLILVMIQCLMGGHMQIRSEHHLYGLPVGSSWIYMDASTIFNEKAHAEPVQSPNNT